MALLFMDSFDHYATAQLLLKWTDTNGTITINTSNGRRSTGSMRSDGQTTRYARKTLQTSAATVICGFAIKIAGGASQAGYLFGFGDNGTDQMNLFVNLDATVSVRRGATNLATSSATLNVGGAYQYVEFKVVHSATGSYEVRLNGTNILSATGVDTTNTANNSANQISFFNRAGQTIGGFGAVSNIDIDDLYVCDGTTAANNDFLGDVRADCYFSNGNGNSSQLAGSDGNSTDNYLLIDDATPNDDTDYVESATVSQQDTYAFANMAHTPATINGVQVAMYAKKSDSGLRSIASVTRSGGSDTAGTTQALSTGYIYYLQMIENDPNTAAAWTQSGFNAAEFGVRVAA